MSRTTYYTTPEVVAMLGGVANYNQVRWLGLRREVVKPRLVGKRTRLWTAAQVETLRQHFTNTKTEEAKP